MLTKEPKEKDWNKFVEEGLTEWIPDCPHNTRYQFQKMFDLFGGCYAFYLEMQYNMYIMGAFQFSDLCKWNGDVPEKFFNRFYRNYE